MAISKKPNRTKVQQGKEREINKFIESGGKVNAASQKRESKIKHVQLRLYPEQIAEIDRVRKNGSLIKPQARHTWILEAIAAKLDEDGRERFIQYIE